jgi:predicted RND superfamily exporter protein
MKIVEILCSILAVIAAGFFLVMSIRFDIMILKKLWLPIIIVAGISVSIHIISKIGNGKDEK